MAPEREKDEKEKSPVPRAESVLRSSTNQSEGEAGIALAWQLASEDPLEPSHGGLAEATAAASACLASTSAGGGGGGGSCAAIGRSAGSLRQVVLYDSDFKSQRLVNVFGEWSGQADPMKQTETECKFGSDLRKLYSKTARHLRQHEDAAQVQLARLLTSATALSELQTGFTLYTNIFLLASTCCETLRRLEVALTARGLDDFLRRRGSNWRDRQRERITGFHVSLPGIRRNIRRFSDDAEAQMHFALNQDGGACGGPRVDESICAYLLAKQQVETFVASVDFFEKNLMPIYLTASCYD